MELVKEKISKEKFDELAKGVSMLKIAVDVEREVLSIGCEFHIDCAEHLMSVGSLRKDIWGANVYPEDGKIDFVALINIRPEDNNRSMEIQDKKIRENIEAIIKKLLF